MRSVTQTTRDELYAIILGLEDMKEARCFFRDLLTEYEIDEFANRWKIAQMLAKKVPYTTIEEETGASSTTIARISRWLNKGKGGYQKMLQKHHHHLPNELSQER